MTTQSSILSLILSSCVLLPACAGKSLDVGDKGDGAAPLAGGGKGAGGGVAEIDSGGGAGDASHVMTSAEAAAVCADPKHGSVVTYGTPAALTALLVHRWFSCDPTTPSGMRRTPGIEFSADGRWTRLLDDGKGGLVRGSGIDNEGTWKIYGNGLNGAFYEPSDTTPGTYPYVYLYTPSGGAFHTAVAFEGGPTRLKTEESGAPTWLVPID